MPNGFDGAYDYGQHHWQRVKAWRDHYIAKGCNPFKASELASKKRYKGSWPNARTS